MAAAVTIRVQPAPIDAAAELSAIDMAGAGIGAVVSFTGVCRSEGGRLAALEIEHYPGMAEAAIGRAAEAARARWPLVGITVIHRYGMIVPGAVIVLVAAASAHRDAAFEAARYMMDVLKTDAPFWKREHLADGRRGGWVAARDTDAGARRRWGENAP